MSRVLSQPAGKNLSASVTKEKLETLVQETCVAEMAFCADAAVAADSVFLAGWGAAAFW